MRNLQPEVPHISISVYSGTRHESEILKCAYDVVQVFGSSEADYLALAPASLEFESVTDLSNVLEEFECKSRDLFGDGASGENSRPVRIYLSHNLIGRIVIQYDRSTEIGRHPVAILLGADVLGIPEVLWGSSDQLRSKVIGSWARQVLKELSDRIDPLYGQVAVEDSLPSAADFSASHILRGDIYISKQLMAGETSLINYLRDEFGTSIVSEWRNGYFVSTWRPFNESETSVHDSAIVQSRVSVYISRLISKE